MEEVKNSGFCKSLWNENVDCSWFHCVKSLLICFVVVVVVVGVADTVQYL